jgi:hypothetical protein
LNPADYLLDLLDDTSSSLSPSSTSDAADHENSHRKGSGFDEREVMNVERELLMNLANAASLTPALSFLSPSSSSESSLHSNPVLALQSNESTVETGNEQSSKPTDSSSSSIFATSNSLGIGLQLAQAFQVSTLNLDLQTALSTCFVSNTPISQSSSVPLSSSSPLSASVHPSYCAVPITDTLSSSAPSSMHISSIYHAEVFVEASSPVSLGTQVHCAGSSTNCNLFVNRKSKLLYRFYHPA